MYNGPQRTQKFESSNFKQGRMHFEIQAVEWWSLWIRMQHTKVVPSGGLWISHTIFLTSSSLTPLFPWLLIKCVSSVSWGAAASSRQASVIINKTSTKQSKLSKNKVQSGCIVLGDYFLLCFVWLKFQFWLKCLMCGCNGLQLTHKFSSSPFFYWKLNSYFLRQKYINKKRIWIKFST